MTVLAIRSAGVVYTKRWIVESILDTAGYLVSADLSKIRIIEPSVGHGAFFVEIVRRLILSAQDRGIDVVHLRDCVRGYDIDPASIEMTKEKALKVMLEIGVSKGHAVDLLDYWLKEEDWLLFEEEPADLVVGNPPYIRYDDIEPETYRIYKSRFSSFTGRCDIYVGFWEKALGLLVPGGQVLFICADRWMHNRYGKGLRYFVSSGRFSLDFVLKLHEVDAFESKVSAYPAIVQISAKEQGEVVLAQAEADFTECDFARIKKFLSGGLSHLQTSAVRAFRSSDWNYGSEFWPQGTPERLKLVNDMAEKFQPLQSGGTKLGIGIATGADKVFVVSNAFVEEDRLLPLAMAADTRNAELKWGGKHLVNPWNADGSLVNLDEYPQLRIYFEQNPQLKNRFVAKRNPMAWYRTIDKVSPNLLEAHKLLIREMSMRIEPVLDRGNLYPHHGVYWITSEDWDLEVLGGLLLSAICESFIEAFTVRMRGGTMRFQAQYLRKIRVPSPEGLDSKIKDELRAAFVSKDRDRATRAAIKAYRISAPEEYGLEQWA